MKNIFYFICLLFLCLSCEKAKSTAKDGLNKGGETIGKTVTEVIDGVNNGINETLECDINLSESLKEKGISLGKFSIERGKDLQYRNQLTVYLIFDQNFKDSILIKVKDKSGVEIGRTIPYIDMRKNTAKYFDFEFDKRTNIENRCNITIDILN